MKNLIFAAMGRILAIDYGEKRIGIAVSDPLRIIANGLATVGKHEIIPFLKDYFNREQVAHVVIGYPKQMNNTNSDTVPQINDFIKIFRKHFPEMTFSLMDERFTSKMALRAMIDGGLKKQQRRDKALVDKISATIILQSYMEMISNIENKK